MAEPRISPIGETAPRPDMNREEAQATCDTIRRGIEDVRYMVLDLHDRKGWAALGYESWRACVVAEFSRSESYLYRQLQAALIEREISPIGEKPGTVPEGQLRPLAPLPEGTRGEAWEEARATAPDGKMTARHVRETVGRKLGKAPPGPPAAPGGKSKVNGVVTHDPPDVADARARGRIAADVVVEVTEPAPEPVRAQAPAEPAEDDLDDDAWLAALPLHAKLSGDCLKAFDRDALYFRSVTPSRKTFQHHASRVPGAATQRGHYAYRTRRWLKTDHPRHWLQCPATEDGGCGGSGQVPLVGQCPKCRGKGYWIK